MIINLVKTLSLVTLVTTLSACSSAPRHVQASTPLVTHQASVTSGDAIPAQYWPVLNDTNQSSFTVSSYQIHLSPIYTSALTQRCREFLITSTDSVQQTKRIACQAQEDAAWYLTPSIQPSNTSSDSEFSFYKRISL